MSHSIDKKKRCIEKDCDEKVIFRIEDDKGIVGNVCLLHSCMYDFFRLYDYRFRCYKKERFLMI